VPLIAIQRHLGHTDLGITSIYLQGIDNTESHRHRPRPPLADGPRIQPARKVTSGTVGDITQFEIGGIRPFDVATLGLARLLAGPVRRLVDEHTVVISAAQVVDLADPTKFNASRKRSHDLDQDVLYNWPPGPDDQQPLLAEATAPGDLRQQPGRPARWLPCWRHR
jgi:hypothetical protein